MNIVDLILIVVIAIGVILSIKTIIHNKKNPCNGCSNHHCDACKKA